jgi:serine/threonine protein kinase/tetratricopeptide (TPR) repeat protein
MLNAGTRLGPYEVVARIGAGGMGEVYRAHDTRLGRDVAVKVLPDRLADDAEALARFDREVHAVAALSHPNILALYDFGKDQNHVYAVTELLEGETLRGRIERSPLPWRKALELAIAIAEGIAAAHARGIVHRDLKLDNLFLTTDGRIKILDFGLARMDAPPVSQMETATFPPNQTDPGTVMGTVGYMAPEQVRCLPVDTRCDIFAFGCVLYEMLTGRQAFHRDTVVETMTAILHDEPPDLAACGHEIPPEIDGVIRHCLEKNPEQRYQSARDLAFALRALLTGSDAGKSGARAGSPARRPSAAPRRSRAIDSLAVLPFSNASSDQGVEYLSDGITESLIYGLSQLPKLRVMARSTVFRYKGKEADPQEVGRTLGVRAILSGRVLVLGDRLVIKTELVDVTDGALLWGEQYSRKLADVLAIQEEISAEITAKLRLRLTGEDKKKLARRATSSTAAYQLYLKGRFHWNRRTEESFRRAIEYFLAAIAKDSNYALAHAGLADGYNMLGAYGLLPPLESYPKAEAALARALEIDDTLAEAHTSLAWTKLAFAWDWPGAEQEFRRALALNPSYATAHHWYAYLLINLGRLDEAATQMEAAQELDPLSPIITANVGYRHYFAGQFGQAAEQFHKALEIDPHFSVAHTYLGRLAERQKRYDDAVASFQRAILFSGSDSEFVACLGHAHAVAGRPDETRKVLADLELAARRRYVPAFHFALVHTGLGDADQAISWLERAFAERDGFLTYLKIDERLDPLRGDPRFADLYRRVGLPL